MPRAEVVAEAEAEVVAPLLLQEEVRYSVLEVEVLEVLT